MIVNYDPGVVELRGVVTVLIPLYRHESTVEATLDSLLCSDVSRIELIVCDDASPDLSFERAESWIARNGDRFLACRLHRNAVNLGITGNLNHLMSLARGEFVTLLASDDLLSARAVDIQRDYLLQHPEVDFLFANVAFIDAAGNLVLDRVVAERRAAALKRPLCRLVDLVYNWGMPWPRLFARRSAFVALGPYIDELSFEDRWSALMIAATGRFTYLDEVVHLYRLRGRNTATGGIAPETLLRDMHDVERRLSCTSRGLLGWMLRARVRSYSLPDISFVRRLPWVLLRRSIERLHRSLV